MTSFVYFENKTSSVKITATSHDNVAGRVATFHIKANYDYLMMGI
ncbi:hypothetical protein N644_2766 [Lactiplantibacillus paraplantarum]|nr:Hypothetical protein zj316_1073 [Lactiplantibacillus plantarum ZJ316]AOG31899.1 hypothetical protein AWV72_01104 [Lactiplantibacillus plantarum]ERL43085.1 hypothetical protein N644_2766 [Lactiplantibacillus paraplantarum]KTF01053.1 hypothetical protein SF2A35B_2240 [Lactiplantibacillus plantarum]KZD89183.1 hypothetical protein FBR4_3116 [Lactiplantibacillus plantarum]